MNRSDKEFPENDVPSSEEEEKEEAEGETIGVGSLLEAPCVLRVYYEQHKSTSLRFNPDTTVDETVCTLCERLNLKNSRMYSLVLTPTRSSITEERIATNSSDDVLMPPWESLENIVNSASMQHHECHLKITFVTDDIRKMSQEDPRSLKHLYHQCVQDVLTDTKYLHDLCTEDILKLASLQMIETTLASSEDDSLAPANDDMTGTIDEKKKPFASGETLLKNAEDDYGLKMFLPPSVFKDIMSDHSEEHRKILQQHIQDNCAIYFGGIVGDGTTASTFSTSDDQPRVKLDELLLQLQTDYITILSLLASYGSWDFDATTSVDTTSDVTLVVGCHQGIREKTADEQSKSSTVSDFSLVRSVEVAPYTHGSHKTNVKVDYQDKPPLVVTMKPQTAVTFACLIDGYCRIHNNDDMMLIMPIVESNTTVDGFEPDKKNSHSKDADHSFFPFSNVVVSNLFPDQTHDSDCNKHQSLTHNEEEITREELFDEESGESNFKPSLSKMQKGFSSKDGTLSASNQDSPRPSLTSECSSSAFGKESSPTGSKDSLSHKSSDKESEWAESDTDPTVDKTISKHNKVHKKRKKRSNDFGEDMENDQNVVQDSKSNEEQSLGKSTVITYKESSNQNAGESDIKLKAMKVKQGSNDASPPSSDKESYIGADQEGKVKTKNLASLQLVKNSEVNVDAQDRIGNALASSQSVTDLAEGSRSPTNNQDKRKSRFSWFQGGTLPRSMTLNRNSNKSEDTVKRRSLLRNFFSPKRSYSVGKETESPSYTADVTSPMPRSESTFNKRWTFGSLFKSSSSDTKKSKFSFFRAFTRKKREHTLHDSDDDDPTGHQSSSGLYSVVEVEKVNEKDSAAGASATEDSSIKEDIDAKLRSRSPSVSSPPSQHAYSDSAEQSPQDDNKASFEQKHLPEVTSNGSSQSAVDDSTSESESLKEKAKKSDEGSCTQSFRVKANSQSSVASQESPVEKKYPSQATAPAKPPRVCQTFQSSSNTDKLHVDKKDENLTKKKEMENDDDQQTTTVPNDPMEDDTESTNSIEEMHQKKMEAEIELAKSDKLKDIDLEKSGAEYKETSEGTAADTESKLDEEVTHHQDDARSDEETVLVEEIIITQNKAELNEKPTAVDNATEATKDSETKLEEGVNYFQDISSREEDTKLNEEISMLQEEPELDEEISTLKEEPELDEKISTLEKEPELDEEISTLKEEPELDEEISTLEEEPELDEEISTLEEEPEMDEETAAKENKAEGNEIVDKHDVYEQSTIPNIKSESDFDEWSSTCSNDSVNASEGFVHKNSGNSAEQSYAASDNNESCIDITIASNVLDSSMSEEEEDIISNDHLNPSNSTTKCLEELEITTSERGNDSVTGHVLNDTQSNVSQNEQLPLQKHSIATEEANPTLQEFHRGESQELSKLEISTQSVQSPSPTDKDSQVPKKNSSPKPPISPKPAFLTKTTVLKTSKPSLGNSEIENSPVENEANLPLSGDKPEPIADVLNRLLSKGLNDSESMRDYDDSGNQKLKNQDTDGERTKTSSELLKNDDEFAKRDKSQDIKINDETDSLGENENIHNKDKKFQNGIDEDPASTSRHVSDLTNDVTSSKFTRLSQSVNSFPHETTVAEVTKTEAYETPTDEAVDVFTFPPPPEDFNIPFPAEISNAALNNNSDKKDSSNLNGNDVLLLGGSLFESTGRDYASDFNESKSAIGTGISPKPFKAFVPSERKSPALPLPNNSNPDDLSGSSQPNKTYHSLIAPRFFGQQTEVKTFSKIKPPTPATKKVRPSSASP